MIILRVFFILLPLLCFSQKLNWKKCGDKLFCAVKSENQVMELKTDSALISTYCLPNNFDENNLSREFLIFVPKYQNITFVTNPNNLKIKLYTNSVYFIKRELIRDSMTMEIYLKDGIEKKDIDKIKYKLESDFNNVNYISKESAKKIAHKELGIDTDELFEGSVFPASFEIKVKKSIHNKLIFEKWKNEWGNHEIIDEIKIHDFQSKKIIYKIET